MKLLLRSAFAALLLLPAWSCAAAEDEYQSGKHYLPVREPQPTEDKTKIEVAEVFWYGCGHCYAFEPVLSKWLEHKPADVAFVRIPSSLGRDIGLVHSRAFYAAQLLGIGDKVHRPLFDAIHKEGKQMTSPDELRALFVSAGGVRAEDFDGAFTGFAVDSRVRIAEQELRDLGVSGTPTLLVERKWMITGASAGSHDKMLKVADFLVQKARAERKK
ncbi:MAG TPA: thiol:disulfide interchange protein DsbA/DsbL [Candidatus Binatia bacterium]|nr:thiol:disulfide interchange protein DsbA/DsbL [Candidatus Binatia bacterium]